MSTFLSTSCIGWACYLIPLAGIMSEVLCSGEEKISKTQKKWMGEGRGGEEEGRRRGRGGEGRGRV